MSHEPTSRRRQLKAPQWMVLKREGEQLQQALATTPLGNVKAINALTKRLIAYRDALSAYGNQIDAPDPFEPPAGLDSAPVIPAAEWTAWPIRR